MKIFCNPKERKRDWLLLSFIVSAAFFIRWYLLRYRILPEGDGCHYIAFAKDFINGNFSTIGTGHYAGWVWVVRIFAFIFDDVEIAGRFASIVAGVASVLFLYLFVKRIFGIKAALWSALLIAINSTMIFYSTLLFTESLYSLCVILIAFIGWIALKERKTTYYFILGLIIGASYVVRNEALAYSLLFFPLLIIRDSKKAHVNIPVFLAGVIIFILPMVFFYRFQYDHWTLGTKGIVNFLYGTNVDSYRTITEATFDFQDNFYIKTMLSKLNSNPFKYIFENVFIFDRLSVNFKKIILGLPQLFFSIPLIGSAVGCVFFICGSYFCLVKEKLFMK